MNEITRALSQRWIVEYFEEDFQSEGRSDPGEKAQIDNHVDIDFSGGILDHSFLSANDIVPLGVVDRRGWHWHCTGRRRRTVVDCFVVEMDNVEAAAGEQNVDGLHFRPLNAGAYNLWWWSDREEEEMD